MAACPAFTVAEVVEPEAGVTEKSVAMPDSVMVCGLPAALSAMAREAAHGPASVGRVLTLMVQLAPALRLVPQLLDSAKCPAAGPPSVMLEIVRGAPPVLVRVTDCAALVEFTICGAKVRLLIESDAQGAEGLKLSKVAVTFFAASMVTVQVPAPLQSPLQPTNTEPLAGVAVSVTTAPLWKDAVQVAPQSMPGGLLVTVPEPVPVRFTVSTNWAGGTVSNVAVTFFAASMVTEQPPAPVHAPLQPTNIEPLAGVALSVTTLPLGNNAEHVLPQSIPAGVLVMVPVPVPVLLTVRVN